jgi:hypothetical protein
MSRQWVSRPHVKPSAGAILVPVRVARTVERMVRVRRAKVCQRGCWGFCSLVGCLRRGREDEGREVMEEIVRPVMEGRARMNALRVVGIGREWRRVVCIV